MNNYEKAKELFENDTFYNIMINGKQVVNDFTGNANDLFKYDWGKGIYGDVLVEVDQTCVEQMDTRDHSNEEIIKAIENLLDIGYTFEPYDNPFA